MIKSVLEHIGGVGIYGILSICIFFAFFIGVLVWVSCLKKNDLKSVSALPLEDSTPASEPENHSTPGNL